MKDCLWRGLCFLGSGVLKVMWLCHPLLRRDRWRKWPSCCSPVCGHNRIIQLANTASWYLRHRLHPGSARLNQADRQLFVQHTGFKHFLKISYQITELRELIKVFVCVCVLVKKKIFKNEQPWVLISEWHSGGLLDSHKLSPGCLTQWDIIEFTWWLPAVWKTSTV